MDKVEMQYQMSLLRGQPDDEAIRMIREFEGLALEHDPRGYCVCTSEGKDSRVLGHLFRRAGVKHFYLHSITGIDPQELVYFQRQNFQTYRDTGYLTYDVMYEMSMWALMVKKRIPPMRQMRYCCEHLKERRVPEEATAILSFGVRKKESTKRAANRDELEIVANGRRARNIIMPYDNDENRRTFEVCYADKEKRLNPIADWSNEDIWNYSAEAKLEQCSLYTEGFERLGCIGCPLARERNRRREFERWPGFEKLYRFTFTQMLEARIIAQLPIKGIVSSPELWFEWWLSDRAQEEPIDVDQYTIEDM